jgi:hypothetical protein
MPEVYLIYRFLDILNDGFIRAPMFVIGLIALIVWYIINKYYIKKRNNH